MLSIKSLILIADVYKSISLLRFQEEYRTLSLVSRVSKNFFCYLLFLQKINLKKNFYRILDQLKFILLNI